MPSNSSGLNLPPTERLNQLPPFHIFELDKKVKLMRSEGKDVLDLGVGDPDLATPDIIVDSFIEAARLRENHSYSRCCGMPELREAIAKYMAKRFSVAVDADTEVLPLLGSKDGIGHLPLAVLNPGDTALIPDPAYPAYRTAVLLAGGKVVTLPLLPNNDYLPDLKALDSSLLSETKMMFLNYPNNPTGAIAPRAFFEEAVELAHKHRILIAHDAAYVDLGYDGYEPLSLLEIDGAHEVAVEFHSFSKTFNMTGWRMGFVAGNQDVLKRLTQIKSCVDAGPFKPLQRATIAALEKFETLAEAQRIVFQKRRNVLVSGLKKIGWDVEAPQAGFYCWLPVPPGFTSVELANHFLDKLHTVTLPGTAFGALGEGFIRISLTAKTAQLEQLIGRLKADHQTS